LKEYNLISINQKTDLLHAKTTEFISTVSTAHSLIKDALDHMNNPYLSFSGGKDSTVMLHMVLKHKPDIPVVYWNADASYPDTEKFIQKIVKEWNLNFINAKTEPILSIFKEYGINHPSIEQKTMIATVYRPIKKLIKEHYFDGVFVGLRAEESSGRRKLIKNRGQLFYNKSQQVMECLPIAHFKTQDIWSYITAYNLPYNKVYDHTKLCHRNDIRVSYWCGESSRHLGRWVWLKTEYPELYNCLASEFPEVREFS
jgi:phosphoadenosine phosphosulfate reductase